MGGSSGGYLVSMVGVMVGTGDAEDPDPINRLSARVQTVVARAASSDLLNVPSSSATVSFLGMILSAGPDPVVPFKHSEVMQQALQGVGVPVMLMRVAGGGHGPTFSGATNPLDYLGEIVRWFDRYLQPH